MRTEWGIFDDVACVGSAHTRNFLKNVLNEFCELFPGPYFHLGGDEVKYTHWKTSESVQAYMNEKGLQIKSYWDGDETVCTFTPRSYHTAVPGYVYGGLIASLIDCHITGTAAAAAYRA